MPTLTITDYDQHDKTHNQTQEWFPPIAIAREFNAAVDSAKETKEVDSENVFASRAMGYDKVTVYFKDGSATTIEKYLD